VASIIIRLAQEKDLPSMFRISVATHQASYGDFIPAHRRADFDAKYSVNSTNEQIYIEKMAKRLIDPHWHTWVAENDDVIVGYTLAKDSGDSLFLKKGLFVLPERQGAGIGKLLFGASLEVVKSGEVRLSVLSENLRAKRMYENFGFKAQGRDEKSFFGAELTVMTLWKH